MIKIGHQNGKILFVMVLVITFLVNFSSLSYASNWEYVDSTDKGKYYWDKESIEQDGYYLRYWQTVVYYQTDEKTGDKQVSEYVEFHMTAPPLQHRILKIVSYDENGNVNHSIDRPSEWTEMRRGSIGYEMAMAAYYYRNK